MARSNKRILESKAQDHTFLFPPKTQEKNKNPVWDCRRWGFDCQQQIQTPLSDWHQCGNQKHQKKISQSFLVWRRSSRLKIILLNAANAVGFAGAHAEMWPAALWIHGKAQQCPEHFCKAASVPPLSAAWLQSQSSRQVSAINKLRQRFTQMLFWRAGTRAIHLKALQQLLCPGMTNATSSAERWRERNQMCQLLLLCNAAFQSLKNIRY